MKPILITGASGYIGGRLVPQLAEQGHPVRCLARDPRKLSGRGWGDGVEVVAGDVLDRDSLAPALAGCGAAYYLVHSMAGGERGFAERDRQAARNFAEAAAEAGLERIVYLGGLGRRHEDLSDHLSSRHEVGDVLRAGTVPAIELRAAMIIGAGSASFEMLRALVERLPVMICPKWVKTRSQPIAVRDVLAYLVGCLDIPVEAGGAVYDIGGPEILTYREMMLRFAAILGLKRTIIDVPVLTPRLSAYWVNLMTPVPAGIAFPLIEGLKSETICEDDRIRRLIPFEPIGFDEAVRRALDRIRRNEVTTRWTNASTRRRRPEVDFDPAAFPIRDEQVVEVNAPAVVLFDRIRRIGGDVGWYYAGCALADPRRDGSADRRGRPASRASRPGAGLDGRRHRLLAGRRLRARPPAAAARRDEGPRRRLAGVPRPAAGRRPFRADPDGLLPPLAVLGPPVLVRPLSRARVHLPRHGPEHRPGRRARGPRRPDVRLRPPGRSGSPVACPLRVAVHTPNPQREKEKEPPMSTDADRSRPGLPDDDPDASRSSSVFIGGSILWVQPVVPSRPSNP